ncbi:hypothetical protein ACRARH_29645 [Phytobacter ursingii]
MSGTKTKAPGKQNVKDGAGPISAAQVASPDGTDGKKPELSVTLPGYHIALGSVPVSVMPENTDAVTVPDMAAVALLPATDDVEALEVRAISERGFWRCGRFWPRQPVHVFASDDPEGDNAANNEHLGIQADCFISHADATRLKADPQLVVIVIETVTEPD